MSTLTQIDLILTATTTLTITTVLAEWLWQAFYLSVSICQMKTYKNLYPFLASQENLAIAFKKARKGKTTKDYVIEFEEKLKKNLLQLRSELLMLSYKPQPLKTFIIRDPKTRKISKSAFRDRVIHHALCNIIEPIFDKTFIPDSYANRKRKGTLKAVKQFDNFKRKVSHNFTRRGFVLKADIKHYFDTVDHNILFGLLKKKIKDKQVLWLIKIILKNHSTTVKGRGMPLGNLTSQFFANVYLNELDYFVKQNLKAKYYIRYVDDFVILHNSKIMLEGYQRKINSFLQNQLALNLHPEKSKMIPIHKGTDFLGFKIFLYHKLLRKKNLRKFKRKLNELCKDYKSSLVNYDVIYDFLEGWLAYAKKTNTYKLRKTITKFIEIEFAGEISTKEINRCYKA